MNLEQDPYQSVMLKTFKGLDNDHKLGVAESSASLANLVDQNTTNLAVKLSEKSALVQQHISQLEGLAATAQAKTDEARKLGTELYTLITGAESDRTEFFKKLKEVNDVDKGLLKQTV